MDAEHHDALGERLLDRLLQARDVGGGNDAVDLERDRLVHARDPGDRAAPAVDDRDLPANLLARLLDRLAPLARGVVLLVGREIGDVLAGLGLGRGGRTVPRRLRTGDLYDRRLGVVEHLIGNHRATRGDDAREGKYGNRTQDCAAHRDLPPFGSGRLTAHLSRQPSLSQLGPVGNGAAPSGPQAVAGQDGIW